MNEEIRAKEYKAEYRVDIYIGSDNDSRKIHASYLDKVRKWANATFPDGYTLVRGEGYYNGVSGDSILKLLICQRGSSLRPRIWLELIFLAHLDILKKR